ncbi:MAG TPA: tRNA dihydrouridine(20/20a) synthase DusA [Quisquiliibacterium sp.]|nr:tRNA dihydrouridine(20/20a) synthase DusA [Quisquiliibacterium sp.]
MDDATPSDPAATARDGEHRFCVAPMLDWSDRHCRFFHRLLSRRALLYTEMVTTGALIHGDQPRHLDFDPAEHPVALQLGGSEPAELAACARLGERWGYDEVNLNCGCPSERVQRGSFGACLMAEPVLVRDCVKAMADAVSIPVTVKHRIGIDRVEDYGFVRDFVGTVAEGGARTFIVHARNAWLAGLSPKENREVPPLRYEFAYALRRDFPGLRIVLNGGLATLEQSVAQLDRVDGVMLGRAPYHDPWLLAGVDAVFFGEAPPAADRFAVIDPLMAYAQRHVQAGGRLREVTRHVLGLFNGLPGARRWRQTLSDARRLAADDPGLIAEAAAFVQSPASPVFEGACTPGIRSARC